MPECAACELTILQEKVNSCSLCPELVKNRTKIVFGDGLKSAKILFLGEAPGRDEDEQGVPFVGRAGRLLNNIIYSCDLSREDVYICNVIKCRPPQNRVPTIDEIDNCSGFLTGQISAVNPKYIVCLGNTAAQTLLNTETRIGLLRGTFYKYNKGHVDAKVLCTYHPSAALRGGMKIKKLIWEDLQILINDIK